ncbi:MAG: FAD-binding molybdopterin dehydrogenase [Pirellulaceae bacterium]|nr:MAG: FAD-binding molybdopterin dehydrogenase [Pirellulaceae bacterium]
MKLFEYAAPRTEAEVLQVLSPEFGKTEILAGGTDLIGLMKKMIVTPDRVVNIMNVPTLQGIEPTDEGGVRIGAATTLDVVRTSPYMKPYSAVLQVIAGINSLQLQAQGTIGGELCRRPQCWFFRNGEGLFWSSRHGTGERDDRYHAIFDNEGPARFVSPSRIAPALIALGARLRVIGPRAEDEQWVPASAFFQKPKHEQQKETILRPDQLLTHIELPPVDGWLSATYEVRQSVGPDAPLAAAACAFRHSGGIVREARIVLGQVAPTPWYSHEAVAALVGMPVTVETAEIAGQAAVQRARPLNNNAYKVQLAKVAVKRAILLAAGMNPGGF